MATKRKEAWGYKLADSVLCEGPVPTREEAIERGKAMWGGKAFLLCAGAYYPASQLLDAYAASGAIRSVQSNLQERADEFLYADTCADAALPNENSGLNTPAAHAELLAFLRAWADGHSDGQEYWMQTGLVVKVAEDKNAKRACPCCRQPLPPQEPKTGTRRRTQAQRKA